MADKSPSLLDIGNFAKPNYSFPTESKLGQKMASVAEVEAAKKLSMSSPEDLWRLQTADLEGNQAAEDPILKDLNEMTPFGIKMKYGQEVADQLSRLSTTRQGIRDLRAKDESAPTDTGNALLDAASAFSNVVGDIVAFGAVPVDAVLNGRGDDIGFRAKHLNKQKGVPDQIPDVGQSTIAPFISEQFGKLTDWIRSGQSDVMQSRRAQTDLRNALDAEDSEAVYQKDMKAAEGNPYAKALAWAEKQGRNFGSTIENMAEDPMMVSSLAAEGVATIIPYAGIAGKLGKINAMRTLTTAGGMVESEAAAYLATSAGKALIRSEAEKVIPALNAVVEGGSSAMQAQQSILAMSEEELMQSDEYRSYLAQDMSPDEARMALASNAGLPAALIGGSVGAVTGKIVAPFEAAPLSVGAKGKVGSAALSFGTNVARESAEEMIQGAAGQVGANVGERSVGLPTPLDQDVAAGSATGFMGGALAAGVMQAPGTALGTTKELASAAAGAARTRIASVTENIKAAGPTGQAARAEASKIMQETADSLASSAAQQATPNQTTQPNVEAKPDPLVKLSETVNKATFVGDAEAAHYRDAYKDVADKAPDETPDGKLTRATVIDWAGKAVLDPKAEPEAKIGNALTVLLNLDSMRQVASDEALDALKTLPASDENRKAAVTNLKSAKLIESTEGVVASQEAVAKLTVDEVSGFLQPMIDQFDGMDVAGKADVQQLVEVVGRYNPAAMTPAYFEKVRNKIDAAKLTPVGQASLKATEAMVQTVQEAETAKAALQTQLSQEVAALPTDQQHTEAGQTESKQNIVSDNIHFTGHGSLPSLQEHRRRIGNAMASGNVTEAKEYMRSLMKFAVSMRNKVEAINTSVANGGKGVNVGYDAYNAEGKRFFYKKGAGVKLDSPTSRAFAQEAWIDANTVIALHNALAAAYGEAAGIDMTQNVLVKIPDLDPQITKYKASDAASNQTAPNQTTQAQTKPNAPAETQEAQAQDGVPQADPVASAEDSGSQASAEPGPRQIGGMSDVALAQEEADPNTEGQGASLEETPPAAVVEEAPAEPVKKLKPTEIGLNGLKSLLLVPLNQVNRFLEAFKASDNGSTLLHHESPADFILENMGELSAMDDNALDFDLSYDQTLLLKRVLEDHLPNWTQAFRDRFAKSLPQAMSDKGFNWLRDGKDHTLSLAKYGPANFLAEDPNNEGQLTLSEPVLQASFFAALQWLIMQSNRTTPVLDDETITKRLGLPRDTRITGSMRAAISGGTLAQSAYSDIARTLQTLLGVTPNTKVSATFTQGLMTAMASNAIGILEEAGLLSTKNTNVKIAGNTKTVSTIAAARPDKGKSPNQIQKLTTTFGSVPDIFTRIFIADNAKARYIGEPPKGASQKLIRQPFSRISPKQDRVIKRLQNVAWHVNQPLVRSVELVSSNVLGELLGHIQLTEESRKTFNETDLLSIEGKNASIENGFKGVNGYLEEIDAYAVANDMTREEVKIFFDYKFSSVARLQQQGLITPQGDKIMRELVTATNAVLDLTNQTQLDNLWLTMAQNLGIKVEKQTHAKSIDDAKALIADKLAPAVALLSDAMSDNKSMSGDQAQAFKDAVNASGVKFTMKVFHAMQVAAQLEAAQAAGGEALTSFKTSLSFEADGVTDGPVNAMVHMKTGIINEDYIANLARGGWFFTDAPKTIQDQKMEDTEDLYTKAAKVFGVDMANTLANLSKNELLKVRSLLRILDAFLDDFSLADPKLKDVRNAQFKADRGLLKNPLTVFIYGSSINGIAGKLLATVEGNLYSALSEIAQNGGKFSEHSAFAHNPELIEDLKLLLGNEIDQMVKSPTKYALSPEAAFVLQENLYEYFAFPMSKAIDEITGGLAENMRETQKASQIQTRIFQSAFDKKAEARRQEMLKNGELFGRQLLPEDELIAIFRDLLKVAPVYDTEDMEFYISGKSSWSSEDLISTDLLGQRQASADLLSPSDASVKVSPYLTIGTGDGQMVLTIYADGTSKLDMTLPVFDGIEIGVDNIQGASKEINAAVFKGWMGANPFRAVADGFEQTLRNMKWSELSREDLQKIGYIYGMKKGEVAEQPMLFETLEKLREKADEVDARKAAMRRLNSYVDHMGGAGSPHHNAGEAVGDTSHAAVAAKLREFYAEELQTLKAERSTPVAPASRQKIKGQLGKLGEPVTGYPGVIAFGVEGLRMLTSKAMGASKEQTELAELVLNNPAMPYFQILHGTAKELTRLKQDWYPQLGNEPIQEGQTAVFSEVIFLTKGDAETALHEMIHAWVSKAVQSYYANPESVPEYIRDTVKRLEALKDQFLSLDPKRYGKNTREAMELARSEIENAKHDAAEQMDEFLAYVLSNQHMIAALDKQKIHQNALAQIANKVLRLLQRMLGIKDQPGKTMLSNLRFNAQVLSTYRPERQAMGADLETDVLLNKIDPENQRLAGLEHRFLTEIKAYLDATVTVDKADPEFDLQVADVAKQWLYTDEALKQVNRHGFKMSPREAAAFKGIHATLFSTMQLDTTSLSRMSELHGHVMAKLTPEAFLQARGIDPLKATRAERSLARIQASVFTGKAGVRVNDENRSDLLATFFALAQVNPDLRTVLETIEPPKTLNLKVESADAAITMLSQSAGNALIDLSLSRKLQPKSVRGQLDLLSETLMLAKGENRLLATMGKFDYLNKTEDFLAATFRKGVNKVVDTLNQKREAAATKRSKALYGATSLVAALFSAERSDGVSAWATSLLNKADGLHAFRALARDMIGSTKDTKKLYQILRKVRAKIDAVRQDFREQVPAELAKGFSRKLSRSEWSHLHSALGSADMLVFGRDKAMEFFKDPQKMAQERARLSQELSRLGGKNTALYEAKIKALAIYMTTREVTSNSLARSVYSLAALHGEPGFTQVTVTEELLGTIDKLVSLEAYARLEVPVKETVAELALNQEAGLQGVTGYHATNRAMEYQKLDGENATDKTRLMAKYNGLKGYVPSMVQEGQKIKIADVRDDAGLVLTGWKKLENYEGDANHNHRGQLAYYISETANKNAYRQGAAQTVHALWNGADIRTGLSHNSDIGGAILGEAAESILKTRNHYGVSHDLAPGEHLLPVFDENGDIYAWEMPIKPEMSARLDTDTNLARMLGIWSGRIVEEEMAHDLNHTLIEFLKETYDASGHSGLTDGEWVNLADPKLKDPIYRDAWNTLGWQIKESAAELFGKEGFLPVRKDMLDDAFGYRSAGVSDAWSGVSRWSPETRRRFREGATLIAGKNAYPWLKKAEGAVQTAVSYAKTNIVVRSIALTLENTLSNQMHLVYAHGMNPLKVVAKSREKFVEITTFVKNREEILRLGVQLAAVANDPDKARILNNRIKILEDVNAKMSIAPLIEANEFGTISESLTEADIEIREGRLADYFEKVVDKLPNSAVGVLKNAVATKDSALFKVLNRSVQYGDFVAKAVLYDHLTQTKGQTGEQALDVISEEFVDYNRLPGRDRDALESMGAIWFFNYSLRITKIALKMLRDRPLTSLLMMSGVLPTLGVGSVLSSAFPVKLPTGGMDYNIGPEMGIDGLFVHPWNALFH